jgi:chaperonin GroEL
MNQFILRNKELLKVINEGLTAISDIVGDTMGPSGSLVIKADQYQPVFTKDGASVLHSLHLDNPNHQVIVKLLRDAANRGVQAAGDGTTTTTVLTAAMVKWGTTALDMGHTRREVTETLAREVNELMTIIKDTSTPVNSEEELYNVAIISTNGDEDMSRLAAKAVKLVGTAGKINLKRGVNRTDSLDYLPGIRYARGVAHSGFLCNGAAWDISAPMIIATEEVNVELIEGIVGNITLPKDTMLTIMAPSYSDEALALLSRARQIIPIRMEGAGNAQRFNLNDLAIYLGITTINGKVHVDDKGVSYINQDIHLSKPVNVYVGEIETVISGDAISPEYLKQLNDQRDACKDSYDKAMFAVRIARLTSGVATIYVAGDTEAEMEERIHRYDDATKAALSASVDGCSIGGGYSYIRLYREELDELHWSTAPLERVMLNAEVDTTLVIPKFMDESQCLNVRTFKYTSITDYPVVDATMAQLSALRTAASLAKMLLSARTLARTGIPNMAIT